MAKRYVLGNVDYSATHKFYKRLKKHTQTQAITDDDVLNKYETEQYIASAISSTSTLSYDSRRVRINGDLVLNADVSPNSERIQMGDASVNGNYIRKLRDGVYLQGDVLSGVNGGAVTYEINQDNHEIKLFGNLLVDNTLQHILSFGIANKGNVESFRAVSYLGNTSSAVTNHNFYFSFDVINNRSTDTNPFTFEIGFALRDNATHSIDTADRKAYVQFNDALIDIDSPFRVSVPLNFNSVDELEIPDNKHLAAYMRFSDDSSGLYLLYDFTIKNIQLHTCDNNNIPFVVENQEQRYIGDV